MAGDRRPFTATQQVGECPDPWLNFINVAEIDQLVTNNGQVLPVQHTPQIGRFEQHIRAQHFNGERVAGVRIPDRVRWQWLGQRAHIRICECIHGLDEALTPINRQLDHGASPVVRVAGNGHIEAQPVVSVAQNVAVDEVQHGVADDQTRRVDGRLNRDSLNRRAVSAAAVEDGFVMLDAVINLDFGNAQPLAVQSDAVSHHQPDPLVRQAELVPPALLLNRNLVVDYRCLGRVICVHEHGRLHLGFGDSTVVQASVTGLLVRRQAAINVVVLQVQHPGHADRILAGDLADLLAIVDQVIRYQVCNHLLAARDEVDLPIIVAGVEQEDLPQGLYQREGPILWAVGYTLYRALQPLEVDAVRGDTRSHAYLTNDGRDRPAGGAHIAPRPAREQLVERSANDPFHAMPLFFYALLVDALVPYASMNCRRS